LPQAAALRGIEPGIGRLLDLQPRRRRPIAGAAALPRKLL
jgi:hypothetical protein